MFRQVKSALFWYYLYKFRKRVTIVAFLLIVAVFANSIYSDVVEYLTLKEKLEFLELALLIKWGVILTNVTVSVYLLLTLFKKENVEKNNQKKENNGKVNKKEVKKEKQKEPAKPQLSEREQSFLKREKLRSKADILLGD